jgi:hypothetical protein
MVTVNLVSDFSVNAPFTAAPPPINYGVSETDSNTYNNVSPGYLPLTDITNDILIECFTGEQMQALLKTAIPVPDGYVLDDLQMNGFDNSTFDFTGYMSRYHATDVVEQVNMYVN